MTQRNARKASECSFASHVWQLYEWHLQHLWQVVTQERFIPFIHPTVQPLFILSLTYKLLAWYLRPECLLQNRALINLFRGPNLIDDVAITLKQLERGDLKLRVRSLEAERALTRVEVRPS